MSSNIKYDVHKEAIAIAALNGAGKLVMESIIETKAANQVGLRSSAELAQVLNGGDARGHTGTSCVLV